MRFIAKAKELLCNFKEGVKSALPASIFGSVAAMGTTLGAFAADTGTGGSGVSVPTGITTEMITPIVEIVTSNIAVIMPVGIAIFGIMMGLRLLPRIVRMFF